MNALVPTPLDGVLMAVSLVALLLALAAFISLVRGDSPFGPRSLARTLVILLVPIVGPAAWFVARRRELLAEPTDGGFGS